MSVLKRVGRWAVGLVVGLGSVTAGLSAHGLAVLLVLVLFVLVLAILGRGEFRWIISSEERSDRVIRMISAWRGETQPAALGRRRVEDGDEIVHGAAGCGEAAGPVGDLANRVAGESGELIR